MSSTDMEAETDYVTVDVYTDLNWNDPTKPEAQATAQAATQTNPEAILEDIKEIIINDNLVFFVANTQEKIEKIRNFIKSDKPLTIHEKISEFCKNRKYKDELFETVHDIPYIRNVKENLKVFEEQAVHFPADYTLKLALGFYHHNDKNDEKAISYLNSIEPKNTTIIYFLASWGNAKQAFKIIAEYYNIDEPKDIPIRILQILCDCSYALKDYRRAEKCYLCWEKIGCSIAIMRRLKTIYEITLNEEKCIEYEERLCIAEKSEEAAVKIAQRYMNTSVNYKKAAEWFLTAEEFSKEKKKYTLELINCYYKRGEIEKITKLIESR